MITRRIVVPPYPGWPVRVELRERGGPVVTFPDGSSRVFVFEQDMLDAYGWTWAQLREYAVEEVDDEGIWTKD